MEKFISIGMSNEQIDDCSIEVFRELSKHIDNIYIQSHLFVLQ